MNEDITPEEKMYVVRKDGEFLENMVTEEEAKKLIENGLAKQVAENIIEIVSEDEVKDLSQIQIIAKVEEKIQALVNEGWKLYRKGGFLRKKCEYGSEIIPFKSLLVETLEEIGGEKSAS
jgi:hypothetical protein